MKRVRVYNETRCVTLAERAEYAGNPWKLLVGLMPYRELVPGEGMVLPRTGSIHTSLLRFPIDVLFLDPQGRILGIHQEVPPFRVVLAPRGTRTAVELPAGTAHLSSTQQGDQLVIDEKSL